MEMKNRVDPKMLKVDMDKTKGYYLSSDSLPCECAYCQNYVAQIERKYPDIAQFLASINVDVTKPFELISVELDNDNIQYMLCQYIVYGNCDENYYNSINGIEFGKSTCHPSTNIVDEHFVLEFGPINLKMK